MKKLLAFFVPLIALIAIGGGYFGVRLDLSSSGAIQYKAFVERDLFSFSVLGNEVRTSAGVELYNNPSGMNYLTAYTGYEVDLSSNLWVQLRVQGDVSVPSANPRFRVSLLGGFSW